MREVLIGGLVIGGAYLAYRLYCNWQATTAQPGTPTGTAASSMTASAAMSTNFSPGVATRRLYGVFGPPRVMPVVPPQASPRFAARVAAQIAAPVIAQVNRAATTPTPTAPSPSAEIWSGVAQPAPGPTQPSGNGPQPGDPNPLVLVRKLGGGLR